jgi:uncharacterized membrane protein YidH (DUF202 family)
MSGLFYLGIFLIVYGLFCLVIGLFKWPAAIWNMGKIEGFKKILGDLGTQIFIGVWGAIALGGGIWLMVANL